MTGIPSDFIISSNSCHIAKTFRVQNKFDSERGAVRLRPVEHRAFVRISSTVDVGGVLVEDALAALGMNG